MFLMFQQTGSGEVLDTDLLLEELMKMQANLIQEENDSKAKDSNQIVT